MAARILPFNRPLFTPEDLEYFGRVAAAWAQVGLAGAILRNKIAGGESFVVISADGDCALWSVEKHGPGTYWLIDAGGRRVMSAGSMRDVLECVRLPETPAMPTA